VQADGESQRKASKREAGSTRKSTEPALCRLVLISSTPQSNEQADGESRRKALKKESEEAPGSPEAGDEKQKV
jgi:hypothetical protein